MQRTGGIEESEVSWRETIVPDGLQERRHEVHRLTDEASEALRLILRVAWASSNTVDSGAESILIWCGERQERPCASPPSPGAV